jgi:hypothetical protein
MEVRDSRPTLRQRFAGQFQIDWIAGRDALLAVDVGTEMERNRPIMKSSRRRKRYVASLAALMLPTQRIRQPT